MNNSTPPQIDLSQTGLAHRTLRTIDDPHRPISFNNIMLNPEAFNGREYILEMGSETIKGILTTDQSGFSIGNARLNYKDLLALNGGKVPRPFIAVVQQESQYNFLIPDHMVAASQAVLVGKSMSKKTFIALDLALRVAAGMDWNGFPTKSGKVLYIAGEGSEDVRQRIKAWAKYHGTQPDNFYLIDEPIDFFSYDRREDGSNGEFGGLLKNLIMMDNVVLVVVDTFRTCFSGVENLSDDVSKYFKNARIINRRIGATVLTLHHPAKSGSTDARGAGNFLDDVDSYWSIDGNQTLKFRKVKGSPNPPSIKLQTTEFGGSLIVGYSAETESSLGTPGSPKKTSANQNEQLALDCLQRLLVAAHEKPIPVKDWQEEYYRLRDGNKSTKATAFCRLKSSLLETGQITIHNDKVSLNIS